MRIGLTVTFLCTACFLNAQFPGNSHVQIPVDFTYSNVDRSGNPMLINYDLSDEAFWGLNYQRALFPLHRSYGTLPGQNIVYALYTLDTLVTTDNSYTLPFSNVNGLILDSMDIELAHVKHSGANDTIFLTLLSLDTVNFPDGPTMFTDTVVLTTPLSPGNLISNTYSLKWKPNIPMNDEPIGLKIEFVGSLVDTLALMGGYGIFPAPNSCTDSSWDKARKSFYYSNSYAYWSNYNLILPTNMGSDLFYNCDTVITKDTSDSESYIQNWSITSYVSAPEIGIEEEALQQLTIYPNPANNIVYLPGVSDLGVVSIYDLSGSCIKTLQAATFIDISDLNKGIYIFAITHEKTSVYKKLVIQR